MYLLTNPRYFYSNTHNKIVSILNNFNTILIYINKKKKLMAEKTSLRCIDYRNAKFQGSIRGNSKDGIGIILDNEFMLSLTNWKG